MFNGEWHEVTPEGDFLTPLSIDIRASSTDWDGE